MPEIRVSFLDTLYHSSDLGVITDQLTGIEKHPLAFAPWADAFPYKPVVDFAIAHGPDALFLQYIVKEKVVQAAFGKANDPVYQDSCVEFFISLDAGATYYNFEFNCIGTVLAAVGPDRKYRTPLPAGLLHTIRWRAVLSGEKGDGLVHWTLTLSLPFALFLRHPLSSLQGQACRANFYKCGDGLPEPHFLAWSPIDSPQPDFHLPRYFGTLLFEPYE